MITVLGMVGLVAFGILIGRYPEMLARNSGLLLSGPRWILGWLLERLKQNPRVCGAFFSGFMLGLLVSGVLGELLWNIALVGLAIFCIFLFFPETGSRVLGFLVQISRNCFIKIREFFA